MTEAQQCVYITQSWAVWHAHRLPSFGKISGQRQKGISSTPDARLSKPAPGSNLSEMRRFVFLWLLCWAIFGFPWTQFSPHPHWSAVTWVPSLTLDHWDDEALNFLFYVPLGCVGLSLRRSWVFVLVCAAGLSLLTEATQVFSDGRDPSMTDLVMNVAGAMVGYISWSKLWPERARGPRELRG